MKEVRQVKMKYQLLHNPDKEVRIDSEVKPQVCQCSNSRRWIWKKKPVKFEKATQNLVWTIAMEEEIVSLEQNQTWKLTSKPKNVKPISYGWVYKVKRCVDGLMERHKNPLVALVFTKNMVWISAVLSLPLSQSYLHLMLAKIEIYGKWMSKMYFTWRARSWDLHGSTNVFPKSRTSWVCL